MAAALSDRAAAIESRPHDASARLSHSGNRLWRSVESDVTTFGAPRRRVRERWADRNSIATADQTGSAPRPRVAWPNLFGSYDRRGFPVPGESLSIADQHRPGDHGCGLVR